MNKAYIDQRTLIIVFLLFMFTLINPGTKAQSASNVTIVEPTAFNDSGWNLRYVENFDTSFSGSNGQTFGTDNWLTLQLLNGGAIDGNGSYAQLNAPDFWNAALIRSTTTLPDEYKIRVKIGYINYDLTNYEQADYDDPDFTTHNGFYENGIYFLTLTDDTCSGNECGEFWWHYHRKMVIDVDNHLDGGGGQTFHPVYMVYMSPLMNSGGNLLRTWDGNQWDKSPWNWNVAYTYDYNSWYYAEVEKADGQLILRLYDQNQNILEETTPVSLDSVFSMSTPDYLYIGEPHTDDYEGDARIDEITLFTITCCNIRGDINHRSDPSPINISDLTYLVSYIFRGGPPPVCEEEGDLNNDSSTDISDLTYLVDYLFRLGPPPVPCD